LKNYLKATSIESLKIYLPSAFSNLVCETKSTSTNSNDREDSEEEGVYQMAMP